jgi:hypothetical protein
VASVQERAALRKRRPELETAGCGSLCPSNEESAILTAVSNGVTCFDCDVSAYYCDGRGRGPGPCRGGCHDHGYPYRVGVPYPSRRAYCHQHRRWVQPAAAPRGPRG